jgi:hypothetical protein
MRRSVRSALLTTAAISSSVCRFPFAGLPLRPERKLDGARVAAWARHVVDANSPSLRPPAPQPRSERGPINRLDEPAARAPSAARAHRIARVDIAIFMRPSGRTY